MVTYEFNGYKSFSFQSSQGMFLIQCSNILWLGMASKFLRVIREGTRYEKYF